MNEANVYHRYHGMQDRDANITLAHYKQKLKLDKKHKILDIGCGPGDLTYKYLLPLIPKNGTMVGIDVSPTMINYANSNYKDSRLSFEIMDITNPIIADKYTQTFDSIFSFYCLHWIQDQRTAMRNISKMMKSGGNCLLVFLAHSPIYTLYEILANNPRWQPYMKDFKNYISPYHYSADPIKDIQNLAKEVGLQIEDCRNTPTTYTVPSEEVLYKSIQAVNPFLNFIPDHLMEGYFDDCKKITWKAKLCSFNSNNEILLQYSLITVYAKKPIKNIPNFCTGNSILNFSN